VLVRSMNKSVLKLTLLRLFSELYIHPCNVLIFYYKSMYVLHPFVHAFYGACVYNVDVVPVLMYVLHDIVYFLFLLMIENTNHLA